MAETFEIETSLTLDYRKQKWGLERIILDSISNHVPADSGGTQVSVKVRQEGQWVDYQDYDPLKTVEEVAISDNGRGYTAAKLKTLRSTKGNDPLSIGQWGEGLKLVAAACLRENLSLEYRSRNWVARPCAQSEEDDGETYQRLCFRGEENGYNVEGSQTVFYNPTPDFMKELMQLPQKCLAFNTTYRELHHEKDNYVRRIGGGLDYFLLKRTGFDLFFKPKYHSRIIDLGDIGAKIDLGDTAAQQQALENPSHSPNLIFVKGIRVQDIQALFSYDLGIEDITPDRSYAHREKVLDEIEMLLRGCTNAEVITTVLKAAEKYPHADYAEFQAMSKYRKQQNLKIGQLETSMFMKKTFFEKEIDLQHPWLLAFKALYGEKAVLASENTNDNNDATILGFNPVKLNQQIHQLLQDLGIDTASNIAIGKKDYKWLSLDDLTEQERDVYNLIPQLNEAAFGNRDAIALNQVRIYQGMYFSSGREAESDQGVTTLERRDDGKYSATGIGIKRTMLQDPQQFAETYFHEAAHYLTLARDGEREHAQFGFNAMARLVLEKIGEKTDSRK